MWCATWVGWWVGACIRVRVGPPSLTSPLWLPASVPTQPERLNDEVEEGELPYECGAVVVSTANPSVPIVPGDRLLTINGVNVGQSPLRPVSFDSVATVLRETFEAAWSLQPCVISVARPLVAAPSLAPLFVRCGVCVQCCGPWGFWRAALIWFVLHPWIITPCVLQGGTPPCRRCTKATGVTAHAYCCVSCRPVCHTLAPLTPRCPTGHLCLVSCPRRL